MGPLAAVELTLQLLVLLREHQQVLRYLHGFLVELRRLINLLLLLDAPTRQVVRHCVRVVQEIRGKIIIATAGRSLPGLLFPAITLTSLAFYLRQHLPIHSLRLQIVELNEVLQIDFLRFAQRLARRSWRFTGIRSFWLAWLA